MSASLISGLESFRFSPHETERVEPDWQSILLADITSFWLVFRPFGEPYESAHGWSIAIATPKRVILLYPTQYDEQGRVYIACRPLSNADHNTYGESFAHIVSETKAHFGRVAVPNIKVIDVLHDLERSGIINYHIHDGLGLRFWVSLALYQLGKFLKEPNPNHKLPEISLTVMRQWDFLGSEIATEPIRIGFCNLHLFSNEAFNNWKSCVEKYREVCMAGGTKEQYMGVFRG